jgi:tryptophanyl-tRNA synthetase
MSKTLNNHIEISSPPEEIRKRVMMMVTDPQRRYRTDPGRPEVCNVFTLHGFYSPQQVAEIERACRTAQIGCVECKEILAKNLAESLAPFRARREELAAQPDLVWDILADGAKRARAIAEVTLAEVKEAVALP